MDALDELRTLTVPTLANAVEAFGVAAPNAGYNTQPFRADVAAASCFAGYAVTLTATTDRPPDAAPAEIDEPEYWRWLASVPGPKILVLEDLDDPPGGAMLGEWNANVHRALGCVGAVVQGAIRDYPALDQLGFSVLATSLSVAHGYGRFVGYGEPVTVAGLRVETGDLLVADMHGVLRIPPEIPVAELVAAGREIDRLESEIFAARAVARVRRRFVGTVAGVGARAVAARAAHGSDLMARRRDWFAMSAGAIRLASGVSFLVAPDAANRLWGDDADNGPTASLLLRSMGYRDALIGGLLFASGPRGDGSSAGWFLASAGADAADLLGGFANHDRMSAQQRARGLGGAAVGIGVGLLGAVRARRLRAPA